MKKKVKNKIINSSDSEFFFDDCPICQAMKKAKEKGKDLTETELKQSFLDAKKQGAVVGGQLLEEPKN